MSSPFIQIAMLVLLLLTSVGLVRLCGSAILPSLKARRLARSGFEKAPTKRPNAMPEVADLTWVRIATGLAFLSLPGSVLIVLVERFVLHEPSLLFEDLIPNFIPALAFLGLVTTVSAWPRSRRSVHHGKLIVDRIALLITVGILLCVLIQRVKVEFLTDQRTLLEVPTYYVKGSALLAAALVLIAGILSLSRSESPR
jgi:hypothetical protein